MKKTILTTFIATILCLSIILTGCFSNTDYIIHDGKKRFFNARLPYKINLPSSYDPSNSYPLVFVFHGGGADR